MRNRFLKTIAALFLGLLFVLTGAHASAASWADTNQLYDDPIQDGNGVTQNGATVGGTFTYSGAGTYSYSLNALSGTNLDEIDMNGVTTQTNFVWMVRFQCEFQSSSLGNCGVRWYDADSLNNTDTFQCGTSLGISGGTATCVFAENNASVASFPGTFPSSCFGVAVAPSGWCWLKLVVLNHSATAYIATDNNGIPSTWNLVGSQKLTGATGTKYTLHAYQANMWVGGGAYPCMNHISTNPNYDCSTWQDANLQWTDNFWGTFPYTTAGTAPTLTAGATMSLAASSNVFFLPFGNVSAISIPNFVYYLRVNSESQNNTNTQDVELFNQNTVALSGSHGNLLELNTAHTTSTTLYFVPSSGTSTTLATASVAPTAPYYLKTIYSNGILSFYYSNTTSNVPTSALTWTPLFTNVDVSSYLPLLGPYFAWWNGSGVTYTLGGGTNLPCRLYISLNPNWDCFSQAIYFHKGVLFPSSIYWDSLNDTSKMTTYGTAPTVSGGQASTAASGGLTAAYYNSTSGWQNSAVLARIVPSDGNGQITLRSSGTGNGSSLYGCTAHLFSNQIMVQDFESGTNNYQTYNLPQTISAGYLYAYTIGNTLYATAFSELSPGVIGQPLLTETEPCSVNSGYDGFNIKNTTTGTIIGGSQSGGNAFPIIMWNYGSNTPPPFPPFGGTFNPVQFLWDSESNTSQLASLTFGNCNGLPSLAANQEFVYAVVNGNASYKCNLWANTSTYQNRSVNVRVDLGSGGNFAGQQPNLIILYTSSTNLIKPYVNSSNQLCLTVNGTNEGSGYCSAAVAASPTHAYDFFGALDDNVIYAQLCPETSVGVPNFSSCVTMPSFTTSGFTTGSVGYLGASNGGTGNSWIGGAYPYVTARDYGDAHPPHTLSQFLRGTGY